MSISSATESRQLQAALTMLAEVRPDLEPRLEELADAVPRKPGTSGCAQCELSWN
jgi:hypothetical protein